VPPRPSITPVPERSADEQRVALFFASEEGATKVVVEIVRIDSRASTVVGKEKSGTEYVFHYFLETRVRRLAPTESVRTLKEILAQDSTGFPLAPEQTVLVTWKPNPAGTQRIAIQFTFFESP
jgi:hypothetical protein